MRRTAKYVTLCFAVCFLLLLPVRAQAAVRTGTYEKNTTSNGTTVSTRTVVIKKITKKKVVFQISFTSLRRLASTKKIVGKRKGNKVTFTYYSPNWDEYGTGTMKLYKNYVKIKTTTTKSNLGGYIGTSGKWVKLKRTSGSKKFITY
ncbi:MAG: hypothetical protein LUF92_18130 [Clostridiales bacterium]|nr:hypothetical protein [Clostridiales bacterium]